MKLFKTDSPYLTKDQWRRLFLALSIMTIVLYVAAAIASYCGSTYFLISYHNEQLDRIQLYLAMHKMFPAMLWVFSTIEFTIIVSFALRKRVKWYFILIYYLVPVLVASLFPKTPVLVYTIGTLVYQVLVVMAEQLIATKRINWKLFLKQVLMLAIAQAVSYSLQWLIYIIKSGYATSTTHIMNLSSQFVYSLEYNLALLVILFTISLFINREKGDSKSWATYQVQFGSSQTSKKKSQKSSQMMKKLTKTQRSKLRRLYIKVYLTQTLGFLLLMVLPFLLGKVLEFLIMYFSFAIARYILGFKYSLHYKKESVCITVGVIVFGILSLAVPFFTVNVILALVLGVALAILLHLSYKYKSMWLFNKVSKPDKFALLYTFFDGDLEEHHVKKICKYKGLDNSQIQLIWDFVQGNKLSYLAWKHNYSQRMLIYKLDEAIEKLVD